MWDWARAEREAVVVQLVCLPSADDPLLLLADTRALPEWGEGLRLLPIATVLRAFLSCRLRIWDELPIGGDREQKVLTEEDERDVGVFLDCILLLHTGFDPSTFHPVTPDARLIGTTSLFKEALSHVADTAQMLQLYDFLPPPSALISGRLLAHISRNTPQARDLNEQKLSPEFDRVIEQLLAVAKFPFLRPHAVEPPLAEGTISREVRLAEQRRLRAAQAPIAAQGSTSAAPPMRVHALEQHASEAPGRGVANVAAAPSIPVAVGGGDGAEAPLLMACAECGLMREGRVDQANPTTLTLNPKP